MWQRKPPLLLRLFLRPGDDFLRKRMSAKPGLWKLQREPALILIFRFAFRKGRDILNCARLAGIANGLALDHLRQRFPLFFIGRRIVGHE